MQKRLVGTEPPKRSKSQKAQKQDEAAVVDPSDPYALIKITKNEMNDDVACDICQDGDDEENDEIVICELCLGATH
jgi:hypothetical protein